MPALSARVGVDCVCMMPKYLKLMTDGVKINIIIKHTGETPKVEKEETNALPICTEYGLNFVGGE